MYQGYQESLKREVLIKRLHPQFVSDPEIRARFEREAHALARIKHKNIVHIYDYRADDELMLLVQEWIGGGSVAEFMRSNGPLDEREAIALAIDVLEGLEVAHNAKVVHRDIKPSNLMLAQAGAIKITDFGLAHFEGSPTLTQQGAIMGTPAYMPPEVVNGAPGDIRGDLYSFGVTLYELLTGDNPFQADHISQTLQRVLTVRPTKLEGVHDETNRLLLSTMAKDPNQRPASARAVLHLLKPLAVQLGAEEGWGSLELPPPSPPDENGTGEPKPVRDTTTHSIRPTTRAKPSRRFVVAAWAAMVLVTVLVIVYSATNLFVGDEAGDVIPQDSSLALLDADGSEDLDESSGERENTDSDLVNTEGSDETQPGQTEPENEQNLADQDQIQVDPVSSVENDDQFASSDENVSAESEQDLALSEIPVAMPSLEPSLSSDSGYVILSVQPWAHVYFNDRMVGTTPLQSPLRLPSGKAQISFVNPQFPRVNRDFRVPTAGDTSLYTVDLYGEIGVIEFINAIPWAEVSLDGEYIGDTPIGRPILVSPGEHVLLFHHPDLLDEEQTFTISAGEKSSYRANLYD